MIRELVRLRDRNQITLPSEIAERLSAGPGSLLELVMDANSDHVELRRAQVVRAGTPQAKRQLQQAQNDIQEGRFSTFANTQELVDDLERTREAISRDPSESEHIDIVREFEALRNRLGIIEAQVIKRRAGRPAIPTSSKASSKG